MKFRSLQENLRKTLWERIETGNLTGLKLAAQTGFKQAHISNFLNRKRGLSLEGMDKVLAVQHLSVLDLLDAAEINKRASILPPSNDEFENIVLVDPPVAAQQPLLTNETVEDILKFKKSFLRRLRPQPEGTRHDWQRFVLIRVDAYEGNCMSPRLQPGAIVLIDRHYNSLTPYRKNELTMYAVRKNDTCAIRYVELLGQQLILRPENPRSRVDVVPIEEGKSAHDYIVGRICHISIET
jgi:hypothetical protein